jgi:hypothetical protein
LADPELACDRQEDLLVCTYLRDMRLTFLAFLKRPDDKQVSLSEFQKTFNAIEMDMRFEDETKAELHFRVEELRNTLWKGVSTS